MQPTGWNGQPTPGAPPPPPGWGDHAPGFANPAPTWGAAPGPNPGPPAAEPRGTGWTVAAHLVLWVGLLVVSATTSPLLRPLVEAGVPGRAVNTIGTLYQLLPVAVALVLAGRGAVLRLVGAGVGVVLAFLAVLFQFAPGAFEVSWVSRLAAFVFALGGWMVLRRHARVGYALLGVLVLVLLLWFPPWDLALDLRNVPVTQGSRSPFVISLWFQLPVLAAGVIGGISSLLRPRPTRTGDAVGIAVVGGLAALLAVTVVLGYVYDLVR